MPFESINAGILSILPPVIAIILAVITKEVIFSLMLGILSGTVIYSLFIGSGFFGMMALTMELIIDKVSANADMLIFLALLGSLVAVITRAGGPAAYARWAIRRIKTAKGAGLTVSFLGLILFIDDYFSCLCIGNVMRPITDRHKIPREKLSYLIDTTAAPVSIIAPLSSWAAAVVSMLGAGGFETFLKTIPLNLYALLSIFMVFWLCIKKESDYGSMVKIITREPSSKEIDEIGSMEFSERGKIFDLITPILLLIVSSGFGMFYYGNNDAGKALALGAFISLTAAFLMYIPRRLLSIKDFFYSMGLGIKSISPALLILILAWTISSVCHDLLSTGIYISEVFIRFNFPMPLLPMVFFITACLLSFSTGTSWGTYGILIPIALGITHNGDSVLVIITLSAILGGGVFGDHSSPISDSTILSSTASQCPHMDHVKTQLPYALTAAAVCVMGYILAGFTASLGYGISIIIMLIFSLGLLTAILAVIPKLNRNNERKVLS